MLVILQFERYGNMFMQITYRTGVTLWAGLSRDIDPVAWREPPKWYEEKK